MIAQVLSYKYDTKLLH